MDASCNAKPAVVAVVGPTATGKTALGVALAQQFSGEVISADSMQIYKGLDVGTAKVTPQETCGIPHHGVDILTPEKTFSVADFTAVMRPEIAVLCIPKSAAAECADLLVECGIKAFWNFSHLDLTERYKDIVVENVHLGDSLMLLSYGLTNL